MMRLGALIAVIFAAGVAAGYVFAPNDEAAKPVELAAVARTDSGAESLRADLERLRRERDQLAADNAEMEQELSVLRAEQALMDEVLQDAASAGESTAGGAAPASQGDRAPSRGEMWGRRGGTSPTPEQLAEMRRNFEAQRQQWQQRVDDQITAMNDPNAVANYQSLIDLQQQQDQLRRAMRDAKTDEERQKLEAQYEAASQSARDTLYAQQNAMLQNLAATSGIQDSAAQQKFVEDMRATLNNPFFRMEPMLLGGRGSRGFGGGGGPRPAGN